MSSVQVHRILLVKDMYSSLAAWGTGRLRAASILCLSRSYATGIKPCSHGPSVWQLTLNLGRKWSPPMERAFVLRGLLLDYHRSQTPFTLYTFPDVVWPIAARSIGNINHILPLDKIVSREGYFFQVGAPQAEGGDGGRGSEVAGYGGISAN